jgi:hypothetical protein
VSDSSNLTLQLTPSGRRSRRPLVVQAQFKGSKSRICRGARKFPELSVLDQVLRGFRPVVFLVVFFALVFFAAWRASVAGNRRHAPCKVTERVTGGQQAGRPRGSTLSGFPFGHAICDGAALSVTRTG